MLLKHHGNTLAELKPGLCQNQSQHLPRSHAKRIVHCGGGDILRKLTAGIIFLIDCTVVFCPRLFVGLFHPFKIGGGFIFQLIQLFLLLLGKRWLAA